MEKKHGAQEKVATKLQQEGIYETLISFTKLNGKWKSLYELFLLCLCVGVFSGSSSTKIKGINNVCVMI